MIGEVTLLDSDTLSEISRGHDVATARARAYLHRFGRLTVSAVTVFERFRGYRSAIRKGQPLHAQLAQFEMLAANCVVLAVDADVADAAATIWAGLPSSARHGLGDILIAATAATHHLPIATRKRRDFERISASSPTRLRIVDWCKG